MKLFTQIVISADSLNGSSRLYVVCVENTTGYLLLTFVYAQFRLTRGYQQGHGRSRPQSISGEHQDCFVSSVNEILIDIWAESKPIVTSDRHKLGFSVDI